MGIHSLTRRKFAGSIGVALGVSWIGRPLLGASATTPAAPGTPAPAPGVAPARRIRLDSNENPYGPSARAIAAMTRSQAAAARYPDPLEEPLVQALARLHQVRPESVVLGCGSGEILKMADMAFLDGGRSLVVAASTFEAVSVFARLARAETITVRLTPEYRHDLEAMAAACDARTGLVYVCNPNNPTGTVVGRDALRAFMTSVPRTAVVLVDEAYHHFVEDPDYGSATELLGAHPNLLVVRTFSKIYGLAGMRLGYALGAPERVEAMRRHAVWSNGNAAVLEAALASLGDADHVPKQRRLLNDTRRWLVAELAKGGRRTIPSETNFVMIDVGRDVEPVIAALAGRGIQIGRRFASLPNWLRVTIGTREETAAFLSALLAVVPAATKQAA